MHRYPYLTGVSKLNDFFDVIRAVEIPKKITYRYLAAIGFSSSNDREFLPFLRMLGFIDSAGVPTSEYAGLKGLQERPAVLRAALLHAYDELFQANPQATNVPENVLIDFFGKQTGGSMAEVMVYTTTFKALTSLADFSKENVLQSKPTSNTISAAVNLNINLPTTTDERVYESLFKYLKDFLTPRQ